MSTVKWENVLEQLANLDTIIETPPQLKMGIFKELHNQVNHYSDTLPALKYGYDSKTDRYRILWKHYDTEYKRDVNIELNIELIVFQATSDKSTIVNLVVSSTKNPTKRGWSAISGPGELKEWVKNLMEEIFVECV